MSFGSYLSGIYWEEWFSQPHVLAQTYGDFELII